MTPAQIRPAAAGDLASLDRIAAEMGAAHEPGYFGRCLAEQMEGRRAVLIAESGGLPCGYIQLIWQPLYQPFRTLGIPEIQDLNVVPAARRRGIGGRLVGACEDLARQAGKTAVGIGVGLHAGFGAAQRLYVRMGYIPDGAGACYDDSAVRASEMRPIDDLLTLKLVKDL